MSIPKTQQALKALGEDAWKKSDKISFDFFALMYGGLVTQVIKDYDDYAQVNLQLEKIGYNIGTRILEDFLSKSGLVWNGGCKDVKDMAEILSKVAFRMYMNTAALISGWSSDGTEFSIILEENQLIELAELPEMAIKGGLQYNSVLVGIIKGALEMLQIKADCRILKCPLLSPGETTELRVKIVKQLEDELPPADF